MNARDAAIQVLREAGIPLHSNEIARRMVKSGLWKTGGKTPGATVDARIAVDIKNNGESSPFRRVAPSTFTLNPEVLSSPVAASPVNTPAPTLADDSVVLVQPSTLPAKVRSFTDAAEVILGQTPDQQPIHYRDITDRALTQGLIRTAGQTPEATMYAQILTEIDRMQRRGEQPRFIKHGKGMVGLAAWQQTGLAAQIEQHNQQTRRALAEYIRTLSPTLFEALIGRLLTALGFDSVEVTSASGDGGIDVRGTLVVGDVIRTRMAVQVKRWSRNVQAPTVQQVRGSVGAHEQGLIITTSDFSKGARIEAARPDATPVGLMDGEQLINLLFEHDIGVRRTTHDLIELGEAEES